jgi:hypothetical protein
MQDKAVQRLKEMALGGGRPMEEVLWIGRVAMQCGNDAGHGWRLSALRLVPAAAKLGWSPVVMSCFPPSSSAVLSFYLLQLWHVFLPFLHHHPFQQQ